MRMYNIEPLTPHNITCIGFDYPHPPYIQHVTLLVQVHTPTQHLCMCTTGFVPHRSSRPLHLHFAVLLSTRPPTGKNCSHQVAGFQRIGCAHMSTKPYSTQQEQYTALQFHPSRQKIAATAVCIQPPTGTCLASKGSCIFTSMAGAHVYPPTRQAHAAPHLT